MHLSADSLHKYQHGDADVIKIRLFPPCARLNTQTRLCACSVVRSPPSSCHVVVFFAIGEPSECGERFLSVKVVVGQDAPGFEAASSCGGVGASVSVSGEVVASKGKGQEVEIKADEVEVLLESDVLILSCKGMPFYWLQVSNRRVLDRSGMAERCRVFRDV